MPDARSYKSTLNLPKTAFAMKANLVQNEPASQKRWEDMNLYAALRRRAADARAAGSPLPPFVFHDGPPYANGDIHLGHLLNKSLKDFVVRSRTLLGYDCPYTPGWDCHGLPIEHKVMQEWGGTPPGTSPQSPGNVSGAAVPAPSTIKIRQKCKSYADKFVKTQSKQMRRLLTLADYENPYLTMLPQYEAGVLHVFAEMLDAGLVYRDLKPVHWSIDNQTALAEAELEYYDRQDTSVFVKFTLSDEPTRALMIWTTTPWTLPANLAVAVHERYEYGLYQAGDRQVILATELAAKVLAMGGITDATPLETFPGRDLIGVEYNHPLEGFELQGKVVHADYVTLEDGTGLVHTAPGHGTEDYQTALREGLPIYCPVLADGTYDQTVPDWLQGLSIWKANDLIVERLNEAGRLFHAHAFTHSYPHDWRGKKPVIFRATEQWFIGVDRPFTRETLTQAPHADAGLPPPADAEDPKRSLRQRALDVTADADAVRFLPDWGRNRMRGMLESRPDWCISRQRSWGLPIPAFFPPPPEASSEEDEASERQPLLTPASVLAVAKVFGERGSDAWFFMSPHELLKHYDPSADPHAPAWVQSEIRNQKSEIRKGGDTFDVWFESGSSWNAVLRESWKDHQAGAASGRGYPADLYLEGSDQHRGWFQHSLLPALAVTGQPPFRSVLTHGFMVDRDGKKMSKSGGNALSVDALFKEYGADVCRWWVASLNPDNDIKVDASFFKLAGEEYRKVRNTIRFLLSNLDGFDPRKQKHCFSEADATSIDAWAVGQLDNLTEAVRDAYENYLFRKAAEAIFDFCNGTLSAVYLAAVKDRLYCDAAESPRRRRTQTACHEIASTLCRLLAPILPHTADEAWRSLHPDDAGACIHLETLPSRKSPAALPVDPQWDAVMQQRDAWLKALEDFRQSRGIDNPLDLGIAADGELHRFAAEDLADLCGVSQFRIGADAVSVFDLSAQPRCDRSWKRDGTVKQRSDGGMLSDRDAAALGLA